MSLSQVDVSFLRAARSGNLEKVLNYLNDNGNINVSNANGLNALHLASKEGHVDVMRELIKRGATINSTTKKGNTGLHIAALAGQVSACELLLEHGALVNAKAQNGFTPLYMAAQEDHLEVVKQLMAKGANVQATTEDGFTSLDVAVQQEHDQVVVALLERDAKKGMKALHVAARKDFAKAAKLLLKKGYDANVMAPNGFSPLHIAVKHGNLNTVSVLLQYGATPDPTTKNGITPLHVAAKYGHMTIVMVLVDQGAKIDAANQDGLTPLHLAAREGHDKIVDFFLQRNSPVLARTRNALTPLHMACQGNHVKSATLLLDYNTPVDITAVNDLTPLHIASHFGHVNIAQLLLDRGAETDSRARNGFTALHIACKKNHEAVIQLLLKYGANFHAANAGGQTPMHVAAFYGNLTLVHIIIQEGGCPDFENIRGETVLHIACRTRNITIVRLLLRNAAAVDAKTKYHQETPLHIAVRTNNLEMVNLLLDHGASPDSLDDNKCTPMHLAVREGNEEIVEALLEHGAKLDILSKKGFTPLHEAARYGHVKIVQILLKRYPSPDPEGKHGLTPLHVASHYDHVKVALLLLQHGASPYHTAKNGFTPLHIASKKNQLDIASTLLDYGVEPDTQTKTGISPLHLAASEGHVEVASHLLDHGASPGIKTANGLTPLHLCARENRVEVAKLLLKYNAPINAQTVSGFTPLHIACHYGHWEVAKLLLEEGADVEAKTKTGYMPLHQAAQQGHQHIIELLLAHNAPPNALTNDGYTALYIAQIVTRNEKIVEVLTKVTQITTQTIIAKQPQTGAGDQPAVPASTSPEELEEGFVLESLDLQEEEAERPAVEESYDAFMTMGDISEMGVELPSSPRHSRSSHGYYFESSSFTESQDEYKMIRSNDSDIDSTHASDVNASTCSMGDPFSKDEILGFTIQEITESALPDVFAELSPDNVKNMSADNVPILKPPVSGGFLVSFLIDARGGQMESSQTGIKMYIPPKSCQMPTRITCRLIRYSKPTLLPPMHENEALACKVLELCPHRADFLKSINISLPYFAALRGLERELVILRTDDGGWNWSEVDVQDTKHLEDSEKEKDTIFKKKYINIETTDFPERYAIISRLKKESFTIGPKGGVIKSSVVPKVQINIPEGAVTMGTRITLQVHPVDETFNNAEEWLAVSSIVTMEPLDLEFAKPITVNIPTPQYDGNISYDLQPCLRLLAATPAAAVKSPVSGGPTSQWEDITDSTPLTVVNDVATFSSNKPARYWLIESKNVDNIRADARLLYRKLTAVPYTARFVVFAKLSANGNEAKMRLFCMTDEKVEKTLESQTGFVEIARSRDIEVFDGRPIHVRCVGNLLPVQKEPLQLNFYAFRENRLPFTVRAVNQDEPMECRLVFLRDARKDRQGNLQTICNLTLNLKSENLQRSDKDSSAITDDLITLIAKDVGDDWVALGQRLNVEDPDIQKIQDENEGNLPKCAEEVMKQWRDKNDDDATLEDLENALKDVGRPDITENFKNLIYSSYGTTETTTIITKSITHDADGNIVDEKEVGRESVTIAKGELYSPRPDDSTSEFVPSRAKRESEGDDIQAPSPKENGFPELKDSPVIEVTAADVKVLRFDEEDAVKPQKVSDSHEPPPEVEDIGTRDEIVNVVNLEDTQEAPPEVEDIIVTEDLINVVNIQDAHEAPPEIMDIKGEEEIIAVTTTGEVQDAPRDIDDIGGSEDIIEVVNVQDAHEAPPQMEDIVDEEVINVVNIQGAQDAPRDIEDINDDNTVQVVNIEEIHEAPPLEDDLRPIEENIGTAVIVTTEESTPDGQLVPADDQNQHEVTVEEVHKDGEEDGTGETMHMKKTTTTDHQVTETEDGTVTVTTKTITQQIKVEKTVESDGGGKEDLIKQMFAGDKGVLDFFGSDEPQIEEEDGETEI